MCFKIKSPGWLDVGTCQGTWGRVSQYAPGVAISPMAKGMSRAFALVFCPE